MPRKKTTPAGDVEQANVLETGLTAENEEVMSAEESLSSVSPDGAAAEPEAESQQDRDLPASAAAIEPIHEELPPLLEESSGREPAVEHLSEPEPMTEQPQPTPAPEKSDRQMFYELDFHELDRGLTVEER